MSVPDDGPSADDAGAAPEKAPAPTVLFAGGGSGGHISPGLAIAERLLEKAPRSRAIFVCSTRPIDESMLREADAHFVPLPAAPFSPRPLGFARFLRSFGTCRRLAEELLESERVDQVVALGGFVAAPVAAAAARLGVPVTLLNLDAGPGRANRWLARRSSRVLSAVPTPGHRAFERRLSEVVGMPLRRLAMAPCEPPECRRRLGLDPGLHTLLVTGASQGAASLNRLMVAVARRRPELLRGWQVLHLAGLGDVTELLDQYREAGVRALVLPFLHRMGLAWGSADAALSRAGASSLAEAAANAVPTLFLPYPHHRDQHQRLNAQPLVDLGAALMETDQVDVEENLRSVAPTLGRLLADAELRRSLRARLLAAPPRDAAATVADMLIAG